MATNVARGRRVRLARGLHPGAWWLWGLSLMAAATRTTHIIVLLLLILACAIVVEFRRTQAPWSRTFYVMVKVAAVVVILRVALQTLLAPETGINVLFTLPSVQLPDWVAGIRLGGFVTSESLLLGASEGLRLGTVLICIGAAASLASPARLLRSLPSALYEIGVAAVVALTFLPQLVTDLQRVRTARRLRGRSTNGPRALAATAATILDSALDRSISLAASMDSRGYGRRPEVSRTQRRLVDALLLGGLTGIALGAVGLLDASTPGPAAALVLALGIAMACGGFFMAGRRHERTRHRRDPWQAPEWMVTVAGLVTAVLFFIDSPAWPAVGPLALLGVALAATPALTAPPAATQTKAVICA